MLKKHKIVAIDHFLRQNNITTMDSFLPFGEESKKSWFYDVSFTDKQEYPRNTIT